MFYYNGAQEHQLSTSRSTVWGFDLARYSSVMVLHSINLRSSALALCYSAAVYCAPVWSRSAHTSRVDVQLNSTMRLISSTLRHSYTSPMASCSPVSNIEPPALRRKATSLPLTNWWRKSSNMTVGQSSLIYLVHHCYD